MNTKIRFFALYILTFSLLTIPTAAQALPEGEWRLASYKFAQKIEFPIDKTEITMHNHNTAKLGGKSGCNVYGASYGLENGKLEITHIISTMLACDEPSEQFEHSYTATLLGASEFSLKDGILTLIDPKTSNFLRFERVDKARGAKK